MAPFRSIHLAAWAGQSATLVALAFTACVGLPQPLAAGAYPFSKSNKDAVLHVPGYDGTGGHLVLGVCIDPSSLYISEIENSLLNNIATLNTLEPSLGNIREGEENTVPTGSVDFESEILTIFGSCLGLAYTSRPDGYTLSSSGPNGIYDLDPGPDSVPGSGDDLRNDDVNRHWFNKDLNNPFVLVEPVDSTTYSVDLSWLPQGDTFAALASAAVSSLFGYPPTETVMLGSVGVDRTRRRLTADDVATLRYAMAGLDEIAGTADDYTFELEYRGVGTVPACPITVFINAGGGGSVLSKVSGTPNHYFVVNCWKPLRDSPNLYFNSGGPCGERRELLPGQWHLVSAPCGLGDADSVEEVFGDDLDLADYGVRWGVFARDAVTQSYRLLSTTDPVAEGEGYWLKTLDSGQFVTLTGSWSEVLDTPLVADALGRANLVGNPHDFDVCWKDAQVVDGADVLSLDEADPLIGAMRACDMEPPDPSCVMSRVAYQWNGAAYEPFDGITSEMQGTLGIEDGFWVKSFKPGTSLRIPRVHGLHCTSCIPAPAADAGPDPTICAGDSVTIGTPAQPDHSYLWSPGGETTAQITVSPAATTTYTVQATTSCGSTQDNVTVYVPTASIGLSEDFEGDVSSWTATGLWHLVENNTCFSFAPGWTSPTHAFYYGQDATCNYDIGTNSGTLTSEPLSGITASSELSFQYYRRVEDGAGSTYDRSEVNIIHPGGTTRVLQITPNVYSWTQAGPISLADYAHETIQVQFAFSTGDSYSNAYPGWSIDDVEVTAVSCGSPFAGTRTPSTVESRDWFVRLIAEAGTLRDPGNVLGQLRNALDGRDYHDLVELPPFGDTYLSVVFPHEDWGVYAGDYASDYRAPAPRQSGVWRFDVIASNVGSPVTLTWEGVPESGMTLIDDVSGTQVPVTPGGAYTFLLNGSRHPFRWIAELCAGDVATGDPDGDAVCSDLDNCPDTANPDQRDGDGDGVGDACDLCLGDDGAGDLDRDGFCADLDCDDADRTVHAVLCGVCGAVDPGVCAVFSDGFELGDASAWSSALGLE